MLSVMKNVLIFVIYLTAYITAFRITNEQDSLDYNDEIKTDIAEEIHYEKSRNIFKEDPMQDDFFDTQEEKQFGRPKTIQKRDLKSDKNQYLYNVQGNNHSGYNQNGNNLEWYSCSRGLVVQLRRTGLNSTSNTNNTSGYNSIYNNFVKKLNNTNNPYNIKNNTVIKGYYGTYKVVRAYKPKNDTNITKITSNLNFTKLNYDLMNNLLNNDSNVINLTYGYNHLSNENKNNITYNHNKNNSVNNPDGIINKKSLNDLCRIISSSDCPQGFQKRVGYCMPHPDNYVESVDYLDYDFDVIDD